MSEWRDVKLEMLGGLSSGKSVKPGGVGAFTVFGSNGPIGGSDMFTHRKGVIIGRVGAYCGSVEVSNRPFWASDNTIVFEPELDSDVLFAYFLLKHADLNRHAGGSAQPLLTQTALKALNFRVPNESGRSRIAEILATVDDLIDNNRRRIAVLEEMAQAIYREWFVNFHYPGHEDATFVDSPLGLIPEGWEVGTLSQVADVTRSSITPSKTPNSFFAHYSLPSFDEGQRPVIEPGSEILSGKFVLADRCILLSKLNPRIPRIWFIGELPETTAVASTEFLVLTPTPESSLELIYLTVSESGFLERLQGLTGGTSGSHQRAKPGDVMALQVLVPPLPVAEELVQASRPLLELARTLNEENLRLTPMRDLLLPKLVTGEIDVSAIDMDGVVGAAS